MAADTRVPPSRLGTEPDHFPLSGRRGRPIDPSVPRAEGSPARDRCEARTDASDTDSASKKQQIWPGLPRGVEFNPSDSDLLWHLAAEIGNGLAHRHPFISEFIVPIDDDKGFSCTHPQDIPGVRLDGRASYFFHKRFDLFYNNKNGQSISWKKVGTPTSINLDGTLRGFKEEFVLHMYNMSASSPHKTDWRLHQYHIGGRAKDEGELVVSKIFHQSQNNLSELAEKYHAESEVPWKDILYNAETDDLDHMSLQERYRILLANKSSCPATTSAAKSIMDVGSSGTSPKRNQEGATYKEDVCNMFQDLTPSWSEELLGDNHRQASRRLILFLKKVRIFLLLPATPMRAGSGRSRPMRAEFLTGTRRCRSSKEATLLGQRACAYRESRTLPQKL